MIIYPLNYVSKTVLEIQMPTFYIRLPFNIVYTANSIKVYINNSQMANVQYA